MDHAMAAKLPDLTCYILPTGGRPSAQHARTVCRRAERRIVGLIQDGVCDPNILRCRLSDFFAAVRWTNYYEGKEEIQYRRPLNGTKQRIPVQVNLRNEEEPHPFHPVACDKEKVNTSNTCGSKASQAKTHRMG